MQCLSLFVYSLRLDVYKFIIIVKIMQKTVLNANSWDLRYIWHNKNMELMHFSNYFLSSSFQWCV